MKNCGMCLPNTALHHFHSLTGVHQCVTQYGSANSSWNFIQVRGGSLLNTRVAQSPAKQREPIR